ncbi:MAG: hypothetical protein WB392_00760 [Methanotrichaceae archaeon]
MQINLIEGITSASWNKNAVMVCAVCQGRSAAMGNALIHIMIPTTVAVAATSVQEKISANLMKSVVGECVQIFFLMIITAEIVEMSVHLVHTVLTGNARHLVVLERVLIVPMMNLRTCRNDVPHP